MSVPKTYGQKLFFITKFGVTLVMMISVLCTIEQSHEKTCFLHMQKQMRRSAAR